MTRSKYIIITFLFFTTFFCSCTSINYNLNKSDTIIKTGLDNFLAHKAKKYKGQKALLITNHSGLNFELQQNITLLRQKGIEITTIIAPEHGLYGHQNSLSNDLYNYNSVLNIVVYNIYSLREKQIRFLVKNHDLVIFDIQDLGMRCYTYVSVLKIIIDSMQKLPQPLFVLDRPVPLGFLGVDGPFLEKKFYSRYISAFPGTFIYNMTPGESALFYSKKYAPNINIKVIKMSHYNRKMLFMDTGLAWVPPSPNLPTYESAINYSALVLLEGIKFSIGRGTTKPFEYIGAPWIEPFSFCEELNKLGLKSFIFRPTYFKPTFSKYKGETCAGVQMFYTGGKFSPTEVSYKILALIKRIYPEHFKWEMYKKTYDLDYLAGTKKMRKALQSEKSYDSFLKETKKSAKKFKKASKHYYLY